ncbi:MAG: ankyrin repeat domain-containing protein [Acidobacteria bacterium]|nr:ankyrin repeat domain-containing protein [Acidobacteriota bacterium]MBI3425813.1 ankyrin repeat domain-containing protein [Acidobacteriota bacterium]
MIQPNELKKTRPLELHNGIVSTTTDVWNMLVASQNGDLARVKELAQHCPELLTCQYDYTSPLHLAVREGHLELVRYLIAQAGIDPNYKTHPFLELLVTVAADREYAEILAFLEQSIADSTLLRTWEDIGKIERGKDETVRRFQAAVDHNRLTEVEALLKDRPELALDEDTFWGEGILAMPAKAEAFEMLELLMRYGARVPDISKWAKEYYFKKYESAVFLLEHGMNPNHMNWRHVTLLHDLAFKGEVRKAGLLLDYGADINPIDEENRSTPLGYAAHWGQQEMVTLLLERGADVNKAGATWAMPLAWARKKGHAEIAALLQQHGAS